MLGQIEAGLQGQGLPRQRPTPADQTGQARPKGRIQAFDVGRVDHSTVLSLLQHVFDLRQRPLNHMASHADYMALSILFDDLPDQDVIPRSPMRSAALMAFMNRFSKNFSDSRHVRPETIDTKQHRATQGTAPNQLEQGHDQSSIALGTDDAAQPQTGLNLQRQGNPDNPALFLDAQFIGLDLTQISRLFNQMVMDRFAVLARTRLPIIDSAFVQFKSSHNRCHGTPMRQQSYHLRHQRLLHPQAIEGRAGRFSKGLVADMTNVAGLLLAMHADITRASLASCGTTRIRAKYLVRVHSVLHLIGKVR
jgi:hypothetical protein